MTAHSWVDNVGSNVHRFSKLTDSSGNTIGTFDIPQRKLLSDDPEVLSSGIDNAVSGIGEPIYGDSVANDGDIASHAAKIIPSGKPTVPLEHSFHGGTYVWAETHANNFAGFQLAEFINLVNPTVRLLQIDRYKDGQWIRTLASTSWSNYVTIKDTAFRALDDFRYFANAIHLALLGLGLAGHSYMTTLTSRLGTILDTATTANLWAPAIVDFIMINARMAGIVLLVAAAIAGAIIGTIYLAYALERWSLDQMLANRPTEVL